jgi:DNA repair protein RecO (recombination protein O)
VATKRGGFSGARPTQDTSAVLLRSVDFGESDRIVTLLTERFGRVSALAKGARNSRKRFGAALEPFQLITASLAPSSGELMRLQEAQVVRSFPSILMSLDAMQEAGRALEAIRNVAPQRHVEPRLLELTEQLFDALNQGHVGGVFAKTSLRVLDIIGLAPRLDACLVCGRVPAAGQSAMFDPARGGIVCRACGGGPIKLGSEARAWMMLMLASESDVSVPSPEVLRDVERAVEAFVARHVAS